MEKMEETIEVPPKRVNSFLGGATKYEFGDFILFQDYNSQNGSYNVSKPIMAIFLGTFIADQTLGFNYIRWINDQHVVVINNENITGYRTCKEVGDIENHIEWFDYVDILGHWRKKPGWKEILQCYRLMNRNLTEKGIETNFDLL